LQQIKSTAYKQKQHDDNCGRHLIWLTAYLLWYSESGNARHIFYLPGNL